MKRNYAFSCINILSENRGGREDELKENKVKVKDMETGEEKLTEFNAGSIKKVIKGE